LKGADTDEFDAMQFGSSVAISGDTIVVGAPEESSSTTSVINGASGGATDVGANQAGAAYVFVRNAGTWTQQAYLKASDPQASDYFGFDVAIDGNTVAVGAWNENPGGGAVYVFTRTGSTWSPQQKLKAPNGATGDQFGYSVGVSADTLVAGAYSEDGLSPIVSGASGPTGANNNDDATDAGAAYVFTRSAGVWTQQAYLKAGNAATQQLFGSSVALAGDSVIIGAPGEQSSQNTITNGPTGPTDTLASSAGAAYLFTRTAGVWSQQAYIKAANADALDRFGTDVALLGNTAVVGARGEQSASTLFVNGPSGGTGSLDNTQNSAGAAYIFRRTGSAWEQSAYLKAPNAEGGDEFGWCVAVSANLVSVGARYESSADTTISPSSSANNNNNDSSQSGAVYVHSR
jgi:hypothetical protein